MAELVLTSELWLLSAVCFGHHSSTSTHLRCTMAADAGGQQSSASRLCVLYTASEVRSGHLLMQLVHVAVTCILKDYDMTAGCRHALQACRVPAERVLAASLHTSRKSNQDVSREVLVGVKSVACMQVEMLQEEADG